MAILEMRKLTVFAIRSQVNDMVKRMMRFRCVQINQTSPDEFKSLQARLFLCEEERLRLEKEIEKINTVLPVLRKKSGKKRKLFAGRKPMDFDKFLQSPDCEKARSSVEEASSIIKRQAEISAENAKNESTVKSLGPWEKFDLPLSLPESRDVVSFLGSIPVQSSSFEVMESAMAEAGVYLEKINEGDNHYYVFVMAHRSCTEAMNALLSQYGFVRMQFSEEEELVVDRVRKLGLENDSLRSEAESLEKRFVELAENVDLIEYLYDSDETLRLALVQQYKMLSTPYCCIMTGWVPKKEENSISRLLDQYECAYEFEDPEPDEVPPVMLSNNPFSRNFETVIGMYDYPHYGSFDPTAIMSIFYFLIFGLMFADVGYGLILILAGFLGPRLLKPREGTKRFLNMFGYCGISCVVMGILFGGWFGNLPYSVMENLFRVEKPAGVIPFFNGVVFNPTENILGFMLVSLGMGLIHMCAGMAIKFRNIWKSGHPFAAIFDVGSWWVIFAGLILLFVVKPMAVGGIVAGVGAAMLIFSQGRNAKGIVMKFLKGVMSLYGIVSYMSDLLSYSRILALGLVAGVIGQVINLITMMGKSVVGFIVMLLVLVIGHLLNLAINVLGTFVHTSRLQYIEFFNKFYEDGGVKFEPAVPSEKFTVTPLEPAPARVAQQSKS
ncbi:MAG: V-type ATP synthase subunit I [Clostridia bacterium]|nr:V-type ATP synthase subunit I [Clostridia bacterium]